ncbi:hypothetical protein AN219_08915, partial [Streptomyces nanshensis]
RLADVSGDGARGTGPRPAVTPGVEEADAPAASATGGDAHGERELHDGTGPLARLRARVRSRPPHTARPSAEDGTAATPTAQIRGLTLRRGDITALHGVDLALRPGETIALMGRNGAGKSTLLGTLMGVHAPTAGTVTVGGAERLTPSRTHPRQLLRHAGLVPQEPRDLLYADTVAGECAAADTDAGAEPGTCRGLVAALLPGVADGMHPRDLSEGQRLALALAVILTARPELILLDEPTRGLDYAAKSRLVGILRTLAGERHSIVLATHDVELAAEVADRVVILAQGETVADGPVAEVVTSSPAFAPQVAKILAPARWLTVPQVRSALGAPDAQGAPE